MDDGVAIAPQPVARSWGAIAVAAWLAIVCGAFVLLVRYKSTPGEGGARVDWPMQSRLPRASDRFTLIMFAHPFCPCTRASMNQLDELVGRTRGRARVLVVFTKLDGEDVTESALWKRAAKIEGVTALVDADGSEAAAFDSKTSGHVVLFDREGRNVFSGGITSARGHEGDNPGSQRVLSLLTNGSAELATSPIFGCALQDE